MTDRFKQRTLFIVGVLLLALVLIYIFYRTPNTFLLTLAGLLFGVLFHSVAKQLERFLPYGVALGLTLLFIVGGLGLFGVTLGPRIGEQLGGLLAALPLSLSELESRLQSQAWGNWLLGELPILSEAAQDSSDLDLGTLGPAATVLMSRLMAAASSLMAAFKNIFYVLLISIFFAAGAKLYVTGLAKLFPDEAYARRVMYRVYQTLRGWLFGQFIAMLTVGALVGLGLWLLGVPFALGLGFIVFVLEFVPTIGPILASIPALLLASTQGMSTLIWVAGLFVLVELLEGNIILPLVQRQTVELPPAVTLFSLLLMGTLFGFLGVLVAAPLAAITLTLIKLLYIRGELGREAKLPGEIQETSPKQALVQSSHAERSNA